MDGGGSIYVSFGRPFSALSMSIFVAKLLSSHYVAFFQIHKFGTLLHRYELNCFYKFALILGFFEILIFLQYFVIFNLLAKFRDFLLANAKIYF